MRTRDCLSVSRHRLLDWIGSDDYRNAIRGEEERGYIYFDEHGRNVDYCHALGTAGKTKKLWRMRHEGEPPAALLVGALNHDYDRFFPDMEIKTKGVQERIKYLDAKQEHANNSAELFEARNSDFPDTVMHDTTYLIRRHESGGDRNDNNELMLEPFLSSQKIYNINEGVDIMMSADAFDFFTYIFPTAFRSTRTEEKIKVKMRYSLVRLSPEHQEEITEHIARLRSRDPATAKLIEEGLSGLNKDDFIIK